MAARRVRMKSREERKAELMAYFEQKADELLDWQEEQRATDLWTIEELVEEAGQAVQGKLVETLVEDRLKETGMRWSRPGAQAMLTLRAELFSQRWEVAWPFACPKFSQLA